MSSPSVYCILVLLFTLCSVKSQATVCGSGWFGPKCQFKCQCSDGCDVTGQCKTSNRCNSGYFGYKCQYANNVQSIQIPNSDVSVNTNIWTDQDDSTCISNIAIKTIIVTLSQKTLLFWIRLSLSDPALLYNFNLYFEEISPYYKRAECRNVKFTAINNKTVDIRCDISEPLSRVVIQDDGVSSLCSMYINRGRNVALRQSAEQTSTTDTNIAANAVDGNTNNYLNGGSCIMTRNETDLTPTWTLNFEEAVTIGSFIIYNRADSPMYTYLVDAKIQGFTMNGQLAFNQTITITYYNYYLMYVTNMNTTPIQKLTITATTVSNPTAILSFCEIFAYGECLPGKWDLDCKQSCSSKCPTYCWESDGSCVTDCLGFSDPPICSQECTADKWGLNCRQDCSDKCQYKYCDSVDGFCTAGCNGYSDPPYCTQECAKGYCGLNCISQCPQNDQTVGCPSKSVEGMNTSARSDSFEFSGASFGIGFASCCGAILLLIIIIILVRIGSKRFTPKNNGQQINDVYETVHNERAIGPSNVHTNRGYNAKLDTRNKQDTANKPDLPYDEIDVKPTHKPSEYLNMKSVLH